MVSDWDRNWAPAGKWAQASVSHLAGVTDVWLQALLLPCQKLVQNRFSLQRRAGEIDFAFSGLFCFSFTGKGGDVTDCKDGRDSLESWVQAHNGSDKDMYSRHNAYSVTHTTV